MTRVPPLSARLGDAAGTFARGDLGAARTAYADIAASRPESAEAWFGLGCVEQALGHREAAESAYRRAIRLDGGPLASAWFNFGNLLRDDGRGEAAAEAYMAALASDPGHGGARFGLAQVRLANGEWSAGWAGYEHRRTSRSFPEADRKRRDAFLARAPEWDGGDEGGRLLLYSEQGAGDTLQFLRFVPALAGRFRLSLALPAALLPLVADSAAFAGVRLLPLSGRLPAFDYHLSLMSLPWRLGLDEAGLGMREPYLRAPAASVSRWAKALAGARGVKVGLVWAGNPQHGNDRNRSLGLGQLEGLLARSGVTWVSLQKELRAGDEAVLSRHPEVLRHGEALADYGDTAGLIANLDLVIAVDTSVAHLAGAMGKPVWLLLPKVADWRWLQGRDDSPWYPTLRLYRQTVAGDWSAVLERVGQALAERVQGAAAKGQKGATVTKPVKAVKKPRAAKPAKPVEAEPGFALVDAALAAGWIEEASVLCGQVEAVLPASALGERAVLAFKQGCIALFRKDWPAAERYLDAALEVHPDLVEAHCNRATALLRLGRLDEADAALGHALGLRPDYDDALRNLAVLRKRQGRYPEALEVCQRLCQARPDDAGLLRSRADCLHLLGRDVAAEADFRQLVARWPEDADAALNYGRLLRDLGRDAEAEVCWRGILERQAGHVLARMNLAMLLLAQARWREGWAEYESRWQGSFMPEANRARRLQLLALAPAWQGEPLAGKRVLAYPEQGAGDSFQFLRFLPGLRALGAEVVLAMPDHCTSLVKASKLCGAHRLASAADEAIDFHVPLMSLPHYLGIDETGLAAMGRYLFAPAASTKRWSEALSGARGVKVGLVWAGNPQHGNDRNRSLGLGRLEGLLARPGVTWVSLQKELRPGDAEVLAGFPAVRRYGEQLGDFGDTAGLIANLDLVIAVDTSVAHLAGAMGKPVWLLLPKVADWRWLQGRDDSPWYPTLRLYRQTQAGDWDGVLDRVAADLAALAAVEPQPPAPSANSELLALLRAGRHREMEQLARQRLLEQPDDPDLLKLLGVALEKQGCAGEAVEPLLKAEAARPGRFELTEILAYTLAQAGRAEESMTRFRALSEQRPDDWRFAYKLAEQAARVCKHGIAVEAYARVNALNPGYIQAYVERARLLSEMHRYGEAADVQTQALALDPDSCALLTNGGVMLTKASRYPEAEVYLRRSLALEPTFAGWLNLGYLLKKTRRLAESLAATREAIARSTGSLLGWRNLCFDLNYASWADESERLEAARQYGLAAVAKASPYSRWQVDVQPGRRLRIGLVSGDFIQHPVAYFLQAVLESLDRTAVELFAYSNNRREDDQTRRIRERVDHWRGGVVGLNDEKLAQRVHDDRIDILIDLAGHTATSRLDMFARRPAPVQVLWLGYFATTGMPTIDWVIADPQVLPPEEESHFLEKPWRLPEIYYCFTPPEHDIPVAPLPALANGYITFGCFNNLTKLTDEVLEVWARILVAVPTARLLLKNGQLKDSANRDHVTDFLAARGVEAARVEMEGASSRRVYLETYHRVDLALDPFPYPGGTTSVEGLWMGVPVLTLRGRRFIAHQGETILVNAGLPDWIAGDVDDYVARAVRLAADIPGLSALRSRLREQLRASPVFDAPRFGRHLVAAWQGMWRVWCESEEGRRQGAAELPSAKELASLASLFNRRRYAEMAATAEALLVRFPEDGELWKALGVATGASGGDARPPLLKAAERIPDDPDLWSNLAHACRLAGDFAAAAVAAGHRARLRPDDASAWVSLGHARKRSGDKAGAEAAWNEAWRIDPGNLDAARALIELVPVESRKRIGQAGELAQALLVSSPRPEDWLFAAHVLRYTCDWAAAEGAEQQVLASLRSVDPAGWPAPFQLLAVPEATAADQLRCATGFSARFAVAGPALHEQVRRAPPTLGRIRIGYLSNDLHAHATAYLITAVIEQHDRSRFEVIAYDHSPRLDSPYRERVLSAFDRVVPVHDLDAAALARRIAEDGIDIAIDLKGWTSGSRTDVLAARPAPVQVQWLGFPGTLGAPWLDYLVADPVLIRPGEEDFYTERIIFLPETYQPNDRCRPMASPPTRAEAGLPADALVLACFNQPYKLTRAVFACWLEVLRAVPGAVLWLLEDNPVASARLRAEAERGGIDAARLLFAPRLRPEQHLARLSLADLALDCTPVGSHTTASDALWAGVPLVALSGQTFASRVAESLLRALGMPELVTGDLSTYSARILELARQPESLRAARDRLGRLRLSAPLFDSERFTRHLEDGFALAWQRHLDGCPPDTLRVPPRIGASQAWIYQIHYDARSRSQLDPGFLPFDNAASPRPDWFEFWPIRQFLHQNSLDEQAWYGFLSPKFGGKTGHDSASVLRILAEQEHAADAVIFASASDQSAYFVNIFAQGEFHHPGLLAASQRFLDAAGMEFDLAGYVGHSGNTVFSNFVIARPVFWRKWLVLADALYRMAEGSESVLAGTLNAKVRYGGQASQAMKVFIQERLASLVLSDRTMRIHAVPMASQVPANAPLGTNPAQAILQRCDAAKRAYCATGAQAYLDEFYRLRAQVSIANRDPGPASGSGSTEVEA